MFPVIDAHIHLDGYDLEERKRLLTSFPVQAVAGVIAVSMDLPSCREQLRLKRLMPGSVFPAFGYHPEQRLPSREEERQLFEWIRAHREEMTAIGEVGLPYYTRKEAELRGEAFEVGPYISLLEKFIRLAAEWDKPVVLHAVYEDAATALELLDKHNVKRAHFHWFKGPPDTLKRMRSRGCMISVTPEIVYKERTRELVREYPMELLMVETDGPWPFEGPFRELRTHPSMLQHSIASVAEIKGISKSEAAAALYDNTRRFYGLRELNEF